jgi:MtrB/PioB family decaheme-associated outer membrane protein
MTRFQSSFPFRRSVIAMAVFAAMASAYAQSGNDKSKTDEPKAEAGEVKTTNASITLGVGGVSGGAGNRTIYNQYNALGLNNNNAAAGILGFDYSVRDPEAMTLFKFNGSNLLDDSRELGLSWSEPGEWRLKASYGELVHTSPYTINTGINGLGSTAPQVVYLPGGVGSGYDTQLQTKRSNVTLGFNKWITDSLQFEVDVKTEKQEGTRPFGIGWNCPSPTAPGCQGTTGIAAGWSTLMLPMAINANTSQIDARVNYAIDKLRLSVAYYGSFYKNNNATLNPVVPGSLNNPLGQLLPLSVGLQSILNLPVAQEPDNRFNQVSLTGTYDLAQSTRASFKLSYANTSQDQNFAASGLTGAPTGVSSLGGNVNSTLAWLGITSRPMPKLTLQADVRYANRDDKTPIAPYVLAGTAVSTNQQLPDQTVSGKLQAIYQFANQIRGTVGADYVGIDRGVYTPTARAGGVSALRQNTDETGLWAELRRVMSETFTGSVRISGSQRNGSNWLRPNPATGVSEVTDTSSFPSTAIFSPTLADRRQEKIKFFGNWQPDEKLALQFSAEGGTNKYTMPTVYALQNTRLSLYSIDGTYALSDTWNLTAYASWGQQTQNQARPAGSVMAFETTNTAAGVGVTGKPTGKLELGGTLSYVNEKSVYAQSLDTFAGADSAALLAATGGLPSITFRQTALKLFGKYELDKNSVIGANLIYARAQSNDWAWGWNGTPYTYGDNTTVNMNQSQSMTYLGVTYTYKF